MRQRMALHNDQRINSRTLYNNYIHIEAPQYVRQMLTSKKQETKNNTIIVGDLKTLHTPMDRSTKQKN